MDATEPAFRSAKRRKIIPRKKSTDSGQESTGGSTGSSLAHRRPLTKKHGATFSSVSRGGAAPQASDGDEESAVVPFVQDVEVENERFMKPTGKVGVAEDKHMVAYVDSKLVELRSASIAGLQSGQSPDEHDPTSGSGGLVPPRTATNRATVGVVEEVDLSSRVGITSSSRPQPRPTTSSRPRRQPASRGGNDMVRDALVDQIMRESQVPLYDHSSALYSPAGGENDDGVDNDTAVAEAFKAEFLAQMEARQRRRPPPPPTGGKGAVAVSSGPKLGGSRSQREKMKALEEAAKGSGTKK